MRAELKQDLLAMGKTFARGMGACAGLIALLTLADWIAK